MLKRFCSDFSALVIDLDLNNINVLRQRGKIIVLGDIKMDLQKGNLLVLPLTFK